MNRIAMVVSLAVLFAEVAFAQTPEASSEDKAASLYEQGKRHFDIAEYPAAIASWRESYLLSNEPLLLFNIAQAFRLGGDCAQANRFYLNYKRAVPRPRNQVELDNAMEKCAGVEAAASDPPAPPTNANTDPVTPSAQPGEGTADPANPNAAAVTSPTVNAPIAWSEETRDRGRAFRITGIAVAGAGGVAGVVGVVFALRARHEADVVAGQPAGTIWNDTLGDHQRDGRNAQTRARVFTIIGAAAAVAGGVLWWYGRGQSRVNVDVALSGQASELSVSCVF